MIDFSKVIENIEFENKNKYQLAVLERGNYKHIKVSRNVICTSYNIPTEVTNDFSVDNDVSEIEFIKLLFRSIGQFEAHEFMESFKYKNQHLYFPHENKDAIVAKGERVNQIILRSWDDLIENRSYLQIAARNIHASNIIEYALIIIVSVLFVILVGTLIGRVL